MTLIPIEHPFRLASPSEAATWFLALGEKQVSARGFRTADPERIEAVVSAIDEGRANTVSFETGTLNLEAWRTLEGLATSRFGYLDLRTTNASLRIWPKRISWVHWTGAKTQAAAECTLRSSPPRPRSRCFARYRKS